MNASASTELAVDIDDVVLDFDTPSGVIRALDGATVSVPAGSSLAIVGESGSGKSTLASLLARLQPSNASIGRGTVRVDGAEAAKLSARDVRQLRQNTVGMVPQDPIGSLDPTKRIGHQLRLVLREAGEEHTRAKRVALLESVQIDDPERVLQLFPHEVSGGMAQRIAIAIAMCRKPRILVADEPTAALDAQVRDEVVRLMFQRAAAAGTTIVWLSHDLPSVARWCDAIAVMYAGRVVERGPARDVLEAPVHPYTRALAGADPARVAQGERLISIAGAPPVLRGPSDGCAFSDRCSFAIDACRVTRPEPVGADGRSALCIRIDDLPEPAPLRAGPRGGAA
ncbi:MAG: ABC transporter ATP-binding protein [Microbacterium sp.]